MKTSTCFKESYSLKVSYSRTVSNYFESKGDIYSLRIRLVSSRGHKALKTHKAKTLKNKADL